MGRAPKVLATIPESASSLASLRRSLLKWYDRNARPMPWRLKTPDPYVTLVSETMLQQTQVTTVIPYFEKFMRRFPTMKSLANATIDEVLPFWAGLGYYRRCHHLHSAARTLVNELHGKWPDDVEGLLHLPGIGRYTAGAVTSIVFGKRAPAVDGNARRVIGRVLGLNGKTPTASEERAIWDWAARCVPPSRPGDFNQALMELGARVCNPNVPRCDQCPLRSRCRSASARHGKSQRLTKVRLKHQKHVSVALCHRGAIFFRQRPTHGLWAGLWEWPTIQMWEGETPQETLKRGLRSILETTPSTTAWLDPVTVRLTHRIIQFQIARLNIRARNRVREAGQWIDPSSMSRLAISSAQRRLLERLQESAE